MNCLNKLVVDNIKPKEPQFFMVHSRPREPQFSPHVHGFIGAIDGTNILVVVPSSALIAYFGRYRETTHNVLVVCDFNMRSNFVVVGWLVQCMTQEFLMKHWINIVTSHP
jgi:hypothetical protein